MNDDLSRRSSAAPDWDALVTRIMSAIAAASGGDRGGARLVLSGLLQEGEFAAPAAQLIIAHFMADVQDEVGSELEWDLRSLALSKHCMDEDLRVGGTVLRVRSFLPSIHLNVADAHRRLGQAGDAREHAALARASALHLPDDGYAGTIRAAISRLEDRLSAMG